MEVVKYLDFLSESVDTGEDVIADYKSQIDRDVKYIVSKSLFTSTIRDVCEFSSEFNQREIINIWFPTAGPNVGHVSKRETAEGFYITSKSALLDGYYLYTWLKANYGELINNLLDKSNFRINMQDVYGVKISIPSKQQQIEFTNSYKHNMTMIKNIREDVELDKRAANRFVTLVLGV